MDPIRVCRVDRRNVGLSHIVQISDLHFPHGAVFADIAGRLAALHALEEGLRQCIEDRGPVDVLAITGDIVDGDIGNFFRPWRARRRISSILRGAREYLLDLSRRTLELEPENGQILVIPGNHDFRYRGFINRSYSRTAFCLAFNEFCRHTWFPHLNILIGCFDSNVKLQNFDIAMGYVDPTAVDRFSRELTGRISTDKDFASAGHAFRIALLHHHPLPLAEAESLERRRRLERFIGRTLDGAPELLMLRNSGTFLDKLMRNDFRLLLHGHLHQPSALRLSKTEHNPPLDGWLEVLACGSTCVPGIDSNFSFNSLHVFDDGFADCVSYSCRSATPLNVWRADQLGTAPYEEARKQLRTRQEEESLPSDLWCESCTKDVHVNVQTGDLLIDDTIVGLRANGGVCDHLVLPFKAAHFAGLGPIEAFVIPKGGRPILIQPKVSMTSDKVVNVRLEFEPPLKGSDFATLRVLRSIEGTAFFSKEYQDKWRRGLRRDESDVERLGFETFEHRVFIICKSFAFSAEFEHPHDLSADAFMNEFEPIVSRHASGKWAGAPHEEESVFVNLRHPALFPEIGGRLTARPVLNVMSPLLEHRYGIKWRLQPTEPMVQRDRILEARGQIVELPNDRARRNEAIAFLEAVINALSPEVTGLIAALYADDESGEVTKVAEANWNAEWALPLKARWGRGVLGKTFRRGVPHFASRQVKTGSTVITEVPEDMVDSLAQHLLAYPLNYPRPDGWAVGVVALGSADAMSKLRHAALTDGLRLKEFCEIVEKTWREFAVKIIPDPSRIRNR
jgi:hypothetical protein